MTNNLNGELIKGSDMNAVRKEANGALDVLGGTSTQCKGARTIQIPRKVWNQPVFRNAAGWNPWLWKPVIAELSVENSDSTVKSVISVDNCAVMLGRAPYDFGNISATDGQVLSGYVFAVIQHPVWGTEYYDVSAVLSCAENFDGVEQVDNNFSILPLYKVGPTGVEQDYRGIPTITMYA